MLCLIPLIAYLAGAQMTNNWGLEYRFPSYPKKFYEKCEVLEPRLKDAEVLGYRVGLRPRQK